MARYPNGRIPDHELVRLGVEHYATPATAQRIKNLVADVKAKEGFTLEVTGGPNIYRSLKWQNFYWDVLPYPQAAYPGTSSHGGEYQGRDAIAVDFNNWAILPRQKWFDYARKHGFTPNIFSWEPWHIVDFNPWVMPQTGGGGVSPAPEKDEKEIDMSQIRYVHRVETGYATEWMIVGMELPGGYMTTDNETIAVGWGAIYGTEKGDSWKALNRAQYVQLQTTARDLNTRWVNQMKGIQQV